VTIEKYRFLQCGILTFLLPSDAYSNFVLRSKPEKNACVESIPIAFIAFPSLMLVFFLMLILSKFLSCLPAENTTLQ